MGEGGSVGGRAESRAVEEMGGRGGGGENSEESGKEGDGIEVSDDSYEYAYDYPSEEVGGLEERGGPGGQTGEAMEEVAAEEVRGVGTARALLQLLRLVEFAAPHMLRCPCTFVARLGIDYGRILSDEEGALVAEFIGRFLFDAMRRGRVGPGGVEQEVLDGWSEEANAVASSQVESARRHVDDIKEDRKQYFKDYRKDNEEDRKQYDKQYYKDHVEDRKQYAKEYGKQYRKDHVEDKKQYDARIIKECKDKRATEKNRKMAAGGAGIGAWTEDEDEKLRAGVAARGRKWKQISADFFGGQRDNNACCTHWLTLEKRVCTVLCCVLCVCMCVCECRL
jgi:hypothetical protein